MQLTSAALDQQSIFICYRREDSPDLVRWTYERLVGVFGKSAVFLDAEAIALGENFAELISARIPGCRVLLAMIGERWKSERLNEPSDLVRKELESAKATNLEIVPVLLNDARMPTHAELPSTLDWLPQLNAARIRSAPDFDGDVKQLISSLEESVLTRAAKPCRLADIWGELQKSEDVDELRRFVETYNQTYEVLKARERIAQIKVIRVIRRLAWHRDQRSCTEQSILLDDGEFAPIDPDDDLVKATYCLLDGIDLFSEKWPSSSWTVELADIRKSAQKEAENIGPYEIGDEYFQYEQHLHFRDGPMEVPLDEKSREWAIAAEALIADLERHWVVR